MIFKDNFDLLSQKDSLPLLILYILLTVFEDFS